MFNANVIYMTEGLEILPEMIRLLVKQTMQIKQDKHFIDKPYERSEERNGQEHIKRALEVAAASIHNVLMIYLPLIGRLILSEGYSISNS